VRLNDDPGGGDALHADASQLAEFLNCQYQDDTVGSQLRRGGEVPPDAEADARAGGAAAAADFEELLRIFDCAAALSGANLRRALSLPPASQFAV
jgi:hypothetical protein